MKMLKKIVFLFLVLASLGSCIKENTDDCWTGLRLHFSYTYNNQNQNLLAEQVGGIIVYIFDHETGILADMVPVSASAIQRGWVDVDLPEGNYTAVAWGFSSETIGTSGYEGVQMTNPAAHSFTDVRIGTTTLDDFRMMLRTDLLTQGMEGELTPHVEDFGDLFFAIVEDVTVSSSGSGQASFDFIKNTSILKVKVSGIDVLTRAPDPNQPLHIFVVGRNERYGYDDSIDGRSREVHYESPFATPYTSMTMEANFRLQRLEINNYSEHQEWLYIRRTETDTDMIPRLDVLQTILSARDGGGNPIWVTQEDIDREDEFTIELSVKTDLSVKVTVNGYEIEDLIPNLGR